MSDKDKPSPRPIASIGAARAQRNSRVAALEKQVVDLVGRHNELVDFGRALEEKIENLTRTVKQVVDATNSASVVLSCVERYLDERDPNWDSGARAEVEERSRLLKRRLQIISEAGTMNRETGTEATEKRAAFARELWGIARELDVREQDAAFVISLWLINRDADSALDVVEELRRDGVELDRKLEEVLDALVARCAEVAAEQRSETSSSGLVGPDGSPL